MNLMLGLGGNFRHLLVDLIGKDLYTSPSMISANFLNIILILLGLV
jgi:hypothetical protein